MEKIEIMLPHYATLYHYATLCHNMEKIDIMWNCAASYHIMPHYAALPRIMPHGENWKYTAKLKLCHSMPHYATLLKYQCLKILKILQNWNCATLCHILPPHGENWNYAAKLNICRKIEIK